jgi:hypothetical protein
MFKFLKTRKAVPVYWVNQVVKPEDVQDIYVPGFPEKEGLSKKYTVKIDKVIYGKKDGSKKQLVLHT